MTRRRNQVGQTSNLSQSSHLQHRRMSLHHQRRLMVILKGRGRNPDVPQSIFIAVQQKSLDDDPHVPWWVKWLLRRIYQWYSWAAVDKDGRSYCKLEFRGAFTTEAAARWAAGCLGGSYRELPLDAPLPEETCQFGVHDFPLSSASPEYRNRRLPYVAISREDLERLGSKIEQTIDCAEGRCAKAV